MSVPPGGPAPEDPNAGWGQPSVPQGYGAGAQPGPPGPEPAGQYGGPAWGGYQMPYQAPKPGIIPLRPLTVGEILDGAIKAIRANPVVMFALAAVVMVVVSVVQTFTMRPYLSALDEFATRLDAGGDPAEVLDRFAAQMQSAAPTLAIALVAQFLATTLLTGLLTHAVSQAVLGRTLSVAEVWNQARGSLLRLIGVTLLIMLATLVPAIVFALLVLLGATLGTGGLVLLMLLGLAVLVTGLIAVVTLTLFATPVVMLEGAGPITALKRSATLVRPLFWRVLGIYLLGSILAGLVSYAVQIAVGVITGLIGGGAAATVADIIGGTIASTLSVPFMAAVVVLLYVDTRIRREGLDVELAAAAQQG